MEAATRNRELPEGRGVPPAGCSHVRNRFEAMAPDGVPDETDELMLDQIARGWAPEPI